LYIVNIKREGPSALKNNKFFPTFTLRSQRLGNPLLSPLLSLLPLSSDPHESFPESPK
jgi:hypothetical protein